MGCKMCCKRNACKAGSCELCRFLRRNRTNAHKFARYGKKNSFFFFWLFGRFLHVEKLAIQLQTGAAECLSEPFCQVGILSEPRRFRGYCWCMRFVWRREKATFVLARFKLEMWLASEKTECWGSFTWLSLTLRLCVCFVWSVKVTNVFPGRAGFLHILWTTSHPSEVCFVVVVVMVVC